ncbi:hypothetical protein [Streptomyces europaeiscabiei]|uniref:hypothetical protein n=1 Tax=Streptomyces europaeiscabiei TaxID=146819 RepID=UPI002E16F7A2
MTRLSREQKRELKRAGRASAGLTPIDVRVSAEAGASVGGMSVPPAAGESLQAAALDYLHRLALATGHPVLATVHDERIGYVVPLQIHVDGSSQYAGEPVRVSEPKGFAGAPGSGGGLRAGAAHESAAVPAHLGEEAARWAAPEPSAPVQGPRRDRSTHVLRAVPESAAVEPELPEEQSQLGRPTGTAPHTPSPPQAHPHHQVRPEPQWQAQAQAEHASQPDVRPQVQGERQPRAEWQPQSDGQSQPHGQPQPQAQAQAQAEHASQPDVRPQVQGERQPRAEWQPQSDGQAQPHGQPQAQAQARPQWQAQGDREPSAHPEPQAQPDVNPQAHARPEPQSPSHPQPKREPRTLPLSAAKPAPAPEPPAPAPAPAHAPEPAAAEVTSDQPPVEPMAEPVAAVTPEAKREPRTMPLTAAKEKPGQLVEPVSGGVPPSTFVLRAVPEPTEGPLAKPQPPRTPGLPLTLAGIPTDPDNTPPTPEPTREAAPAAGTVSPPTGEFGPAPDQELPAPQARTTPRAWHPDQADIPPVTPPDTPRPTPASLEPQQWPPSRTSAPVGDFAHAPDAEPSPEAQSWTPGGTAPVRPPAPTPDAVASPESSNASLNPQPWPPAPADDPSPETTDEPTPSSDSGPASLEPQPWPPTPPPMPPHTTAPVPAPEPVPFAPAPPEESATDAYSAPEWKVLEEEDSAPKPAPVREFDAVAESVLDMPTEDGGTASPFAESVSHINEAVKLGRIQEAAEMAEQTVAQATAALGPQHQEVLKLRELTAYIAYLAGDALRSFHLSLDLAVLRHRLRDQRAAYGNVQSAAAAWRAVRDPLQGLHLGRDLIAVWADLAADAGPAADDLEQLEKARTRMTRLTERARALDGAPYAHGQ